MVSPNLAPSVSSRWFRENFTLIFFPGIFLSQILLAPELKLLDVFLAGIRQTSAAKARLVQSLTLGILGHFIKTFLLALCLYPLREWIGDKFHSCMHEWIGLSEENMRFPCAHSLSYRGGLVVASALACTDFVMVGNVSKMMIRMDCTDLSLNEVLFC